MLISIFLIVLLGFFANLIARKFKLPSLLLYLILGILMGPFTLNQIHPTILEHSASIRQFALIIILIRTGFNLSLDDLKKIGLPAFLMSFVPALFELAAITIFAPLFFNISYLDAALLGSILAAVSPAVIIPRMIDMIDDGIGQTAKIPQLIMASASLDDIFALVLFEALLSLSLNQGVQASIILMIPIKLGLGLIIGYVSGYTLNKFAIKFEFNHLIGSLLILLCSVLLIRFENVLGYSGLFATMSLAFSFIQNQTNAPFLQRDYLKLWKLGELFLFVIVGASVSLNGIATISLNGILLLTISLSIRSIGVYFCLIFTQFSFKEKLFTMVAFTPKATVQAALGAIPLSMGLASGNLILSLSVLVILISAPIGAYLIDILKYRLL